MPSFPHARREESGVACGRRSRHEPLRAPGRTRSGDLPLTRRTLCLLSYRGECRKPPAVRRRPPRTRRMGPDREEGHAIVRSGGRAVSAARACADPPSGSRRDGSAASRAMEESNLRLRFWRPSGCRCPDGAFIVSALRFSTMPCRPCPRRHGMVCVPDGRPTERVPPAEWFRAVSLRRPVRLIRAVPPDRATKPTGIPSSHEILCASENAARP